MATTRDMVKCAVVDFLGCWEVKGEANLSLTTKGGITTLAFTTTLGPPDTPLRPAAALPAPTAPCRRRRPGPARQERDRARVARHQAALALKRDQENQVPTNPSLTHNPISLETEEVVVEEAEEAIVKKAASTGGMKTVDKSTIVVTTIEDKKKRGQKALPKCWIRPLKSPSWMEKRRTWRSTCPKRTRKKWKIRMKSLNLSMVWIWMAKAMLTCLLVCFGPHRGSNTGTRRLELEFSINCI